MQEYDEPQDMTGQEQGLIERWGRRQDRLAALLEGCGATESERHIDWQAGRIEWAEPLGEALAVGEMKALCSYSFPDESLMMAWANEGLEMGAVIDPLPDIPDFIEQCNEAEAWLWAMRLAEESQADYLYRISSPQYLVFLGLWNVRPTATDADVEAGSPHAFVMELLDSLRSAVQEGRTDAATLRRLFVNRGESLLQNAQYLYNDRSDGALLRRTGNTIIEMGNSFGQRRFGVLPPAPLTETEVEDISAQLTRLRANWIRSGKQQKGE